MNSLIFKQRLLNIKFTLKTLFIDFQYVTQKQNWDGIKD